MDLQIISFRGQHHACVMSPTRAPEVLYWAKHPERVQRIMPGLRRACERGRLEGALGWPHVLPPRGDLFVLTAPGRLVEQHRRNPAWDTMLYETSSHVDGEMALKAFRRAATLGALEAHG